MNDNVFWQFNFGNLLTILSFIGGGLVFVGATKTRLSELTKRAEGVEEELGKLVEVLVSQGRQEEKIAALDLRLMGQGRRLDETIERLNKLLDRGVMAMVRRDSRED